AVVVGHNDVARHHRHAAAGDRRVDRERHQSGLRMEVGRDAVEPERHVELLHVDPVADGAVDHHAGTATTAEIGHHHVAEDAGGDIAARIDHDDVALFYPVEHV